MLCIFQEGVRCAIHGDAGVYLDTWDALNADFGNNAIGLPTGYRVRNYTPGQHHQLVRDEGGIEAGPDPWPEGDAILAQLSELLAAQARRMNPPPSFAEVKSSALSAIDSAAEAARHRYITPGAGQALTYLRKEAQARAYAAAGYAGTVPALVQAKAAASGLTAHQAADLIIATADAWAAKAALIEQAREAGKGAVGAAADVAAVDAARDLALAALGAL